MPPDDGRLEPDAPGDDDRELHRRLLEREPDASYDALARFYPRLLARLRRDFPPLASDPDLDGCALQALAGYCTAPEKYRPELASLWRYLHLAADRDARNLLRRRKPALSLDDAAQEKVAADAAAWNDLQRRVLGDLPGLPEGVTLEDLMARVRRSLRKPQQRKVLALMLSGGAGRDDYVAALGLEGLPARQQEAVIKREKDCVHAAFRRIRKDLGHG